MWKSGPRIYYDYTPVLAYHEISDNLEQNKSIRSMQPAYCLHTSKFKEQMRYLADSKICSLISPEEIKPGKTRNLIITYDDGHVGNYNNAFPILQEYGFSAIFFVATDFIGKQKMMDWMQLREMSQAGMSIQSHTMTHVPLETLSDHEVKSELEFSKKTIEDKIGERVDSISMPHGSINKSIYSYARQAGYRYIYGSAIGYLNNSNQYINYYVIPRIPIIENYCLEKFKGLIDIDVLFVKKKNFFRECRQLTKKIIGINNYRRLYRFFFNIQVDDRL